MNDAAARDEYDFWRRALAGEKVGGPTLPIHDGDPQPGFYRKTQYKGGPLVPVAIWRSADGAMVALVDKKPADPDDIWTFSCTNPVSEADYHAACAGKGWPDEPPAPPTLRNISDDPHEALTQELAGEIEAAKEFLATPITTKNQADQAAIWSKRIASIAKKATDLHKVEKQPALDESRRIDDRWRDLREGADEWAKKLKRHLDGWLQEQDRLERQRQAAAREEAARKQAAADEAARAAAMSDDAAAREEAERRAAEAAAAEQEAEARNPRAGRTGARVALRTFVSAEITDFDALLTALKDRPEIREIVETLANRAAKAGTELPGMKIREDRRAA